MAQDSPDDSKNTKAESLDIDATLRRIETNVQFPELRQLYEEVSEKRKGVSSLRAWYEHTFQNPINLFFAEFFLFFCTAWWGGAVAFIADSYQYSPVFTHLLDIGPNQATQGYFIIAVALFTLFASLHGNFWLRAIGLSLNIFVWGIIAAEVLSVHVVPGAGLFIALFGISILCLIRLSLAHYDLSARNAKRQHYQEIVSEHLEEVTSVEHSRDERVVTQESEVKENVNISIQHSTTISNGEATPDDDNEEPPDDRTGTSPNPREPTSPRG